MGEDFANPKWMTWLAWIIFIVLTALNLQLVFQIVGQMFS
jgi:manganese transport protein